MPLGLGVGVSLAVFLGFLFLGMPVYGTVLAALLAAVFLLGLSPDVIPSSAFFSLTNYLLVAVPLFILMGALMTEGGMSTRLVNLAHALVGRIRGGLAHVLVVACLFFGTVCGSSLATTAAIGSVMIPRMKEYGWDSRYSCALIAAAAPLGYLIPPSVLGIMYAFVAQVSVARVFLATIGPGVVLALLFMAVNYFWAARRYYHPAVVTDTGEASRAGTAKELARSMFFAIPALLAPIIILGGIYGGIFTATEASAIGVAYAFIVGFLVYRGLKGRSAVRTIVAAGVVTGVTFIILIPMAPYVTSLIMAGVSDTLVQFVFGISTEVWIILLLLNVLFLILGCFIDPIPVLLAIVPMLLPLFRAMGLDLVHMGAVILFNMGLGTITPPFAANLMLSAKIGKEPYFNLLKPASFLLLVCGIPTLILITYVPQI